MANFPYPAHQGPPPRVPLHVVERAATLEATCVTAQIRVSGLPCSPGTSTSLQRARAALHVVERVAMLEENVVTVRFYRVGFVDNPKGLTISHIPILELTRDKAHAKIKYP